MFNSPIIDLAIALCFTYFVLSLLVSTIHEFIFSVLRNKRGKFLFQALQNLFFDSSWKDFVSKKFFNSVHIQSLMKAKDKFPSYIPAENFAMAIMDQLRQSNAALNMEQVKSFLTGKTELSESLVSGDLRKTLLSLSERAKGDINQFQKSIEDFFNNAMDRAAGVYKRSAQKFILLIAFILAASLNADTIHIARTLWENPDALTKTVDNISQLTKQIQKDSTENFTISNADSMVILDTKKIRDSLATDSTGKLLRIPIEEIKQTRIYLTRAGIPMGWTQKNFPPQDGEDGFWGWLIKIAGILITTIALQLGAPFWFDLLNKVINLRATGKKPNGGKDGGGAGQPVVVNVSSQK